MPTMLERVARLEVEIKALDQKVDAVDTTLSSLDKKVDDLLALRNKGAGAFWVMSSLVGTGFLSLIYQLYEWLSGKGH